jgi:hemoglobin
MPINVCRWAMTVSMFVLLFGAIVFADETSGPKDAGQKTLDKRIRASLPKVMNTGADLFNEGDRAGCYRLYQGSLLTLRPLLEHHPELQKAIDAAQAEAEQQPTVGARAFALRGALDKIRDKLRATETAAASTAKPSGNSPPKPRPALWDRLGGEKAMRKVVDDFVDLAAKDSRVNFDRNGKYKLDPVKVADLKEQLVDFISAASGGPLNYTGKSMKEVHKGMGITTAEFNALAADLKKALEQNGARRADIEALLKAVEGARQDIVEVK